MQNRRIAESSPSLSVYVQISNRSSVPNCRSITENSAARSTASWLQWELGTARNRGGYLDCWWSVFSAVGCTSSTIVFLMDRESHPQPTTEFSCSRWLAGRIKLMTTHERQNHGTRASASASVMGRSTTVHCLVLNPKHYSYKINQDTIDSRQIGQGSIQLLALQVPSPPLVTSLDSSSRTSEEVTHATPSVNWPRNAHLRWLCRGNT